MVRSNKQYLLDHECQIGLRSGKNLTSCGGSSTFPSAGCLSTSKARSPLETCQVECRSEERGISGKQDGCGEGIRTLDLRVMLTTTAFAAWVYQFVVWTFPSPSDRLLPPLGCLPSSLYTFSASFTGRRAWLGVTPPTASPTLTGCRTRVSPRAAQCRIKSQASR